MSRSPEVLIIGAGAIGPTTALELARRGMAPVVVERETMLASGASAGNAGLIVPSHAVPLATPRALREGIIQ